MRKSPLLFSAIVACLFIVSVSTQAVDGVASTRFGSSDISAEPYIMIYKSDGYYPMNHYVNPDCMAPVIYSDNGSASIRISTGLTGTVYVSRLQGTIMNAGGYLTEVSYSASWEGTQPVVVYTGDAENHEGGFTFNLTGIPYGNQTVGVSVKAVILLFGESDFSSTYPVAQYNSQGVSFTVKHTSAQPNEDYSGSDLIAPVPALETQYAYLAATAALFVSAVVIAIAAKTNKTKTPQ